MGHMLVMEMSSGLLSEKLVSEYLPLLGTSRRLHLLNKAFASKKQSVFSRMLNLLSSRPVGGLSEKIKLDNVGHVVICLNQKMSFDPSSKHHLPAINPNSHHSSEKSQEILHPSLGKVNCLLIAITVINEGEPAFSNAS